MTPSPSDADILPGCPLKQTLWRTGPHVCRPKRSCRACHRLLLLRVITGAKRPRMRARSLNLQNRDECRFILRETNLGRSRTDWAAAAVSMLMCILEPNPDFPLVIVKLGMRPQSVARRPLYSALRSHNSEPPGVRRRMISGPPPRSPSAE